jgi:polysaccharide export outer membrane protein
MRYFMRFASTLILATLLASLTLGGALPLQAQQFQPPQWQPGVPPGMFGDGNVAQPQPAAPPSPPPSPYQPSQFDPRFRRAEEPPRPVVRQCAATAHWPRAPATPPQPRPATPPPQVVGAPQQPAPQEAARPRPVRPQGVGSLTTQDLTAATPPQQVLTPAQASTPQPGQAALSAFLVQEPISPIEQMFGELRQFGYTVFSSPVSTFAPVDDVPVGPDYILGPGDDLVVNVSGAMDSALVRTVDRNGRIFLPRVGPVPLWGLSFAQADRLIREELGRYFRGFQTTVTLGRLRTIRVHVVGEVCQPGAFNVSSLSTVSNALFAAGGPTKLGSLREVRLLRNNHVVGTLDLYEFLLRGNRSRDFRLESGDTVFVPTIGPVVAVEGEVKRPAIYELREPVRVSELVLLAGGVTPRSFLKRVQVIRQNPSAERTALDLDLTRVFTVGDRSNDLPLQNGDLVRIFPSDYRVYNVVHVSGAVKYPGDYELKPGMRLSQLLPREGVLPEAHLERVEIVRRRPDLSTEVLAANLNKAWQGITDLELKPLDEIKVQTELRPVGVVTLEGEVRRPGQYSVARGERLSSVIRRAGGFTDRAYLRGAVFTRASLRAIEQEQLDIFVKTQEQKLLAAAGTTVVGIEKDEATQAQQVLQARRELLKALASRVAVGRMVVHLDQPDRLEGTAEDVVLEDGDALRVPEPPASVLVIGSVRTSTSVRHRPGMGVDYYVARVGGFTKEADQKDVHIIRADGSAVSGFASIRDVEPGDTVIVPPKEEVKVRPLPIARDMMTILGQTFLSIAALAILF